MGELQFNVVPLEITVEYFSICSQLFISEKNEVVGEKG